MSTVLDHIPADAEIGVGLALLTGTGAYMFFLAGSRHRLAAGEMFFAGIGGHLEPGESLLDCGRREAMEEIGARIDYIAYPGETLYLGTDGSFRIVDASDAVRPLAIFEMIHPPGSPRAGGVYHIVIYQARLLTEPGELKPDEVAGLLTLSREQVIGSLTRRASLRQLLDEGAELYAGDREPPDPAVKLYPIGTAEALATILQQTELHGEWYGLVEMDDRLLKYTVIFARMNGQFILIRNRNQTVWELPGGKREEGETNAQAAGRELYEETGALEYELTPVGVYALHGSFGMVYVAEVRRLGELPAYEIAEIRLAEELPPDLRYGNIYYGLYDKVAVYWKDGGKSPMSPEAKKGQ